MRLGSWLVVLTVVSAGCDEAEVPVTFGDEAEDRVNVYPDPAPADAALPTSLTCVSGALPADGRETQVLRGWVAIDGAQATVSLTQGPQFWSHGGVWASEEGETVNHTLNVDGTHLSDADPGFGLDIDLRRDGIVFRGTIRDSQRYPLTEASLTCWNDIEVFGSPWAGVEAALQAHFDWSTGECVDAAGEPAINRVAVELVRETTRGECVDLRGQSLNGDDLGYPDLDGWFLAGARLDGASLYFANLHNAALQGAVLSEIGFGYAEITGSIDDFTELPEGCEVSESPWSGFSATCRQ